MSRQGEYGPYMTASRALDLERRLAQVEARAEERIDRLESELADLRTRELDTLRALTKTFMELMRDQITKRGGDS